jgi:hypothetical protein
MLNAILKKLNGASGDPAALQAALAGLISERNKTRDEIDALVKKRHQALLDDESDDVLDRIERQIDRATVKLEKINVSEPPLRQRIVAARAEQRRAQLAKFKTEVRQVGSALIDAARLLIAAAEHYTLVGDRMRAAGFENEMAAHYITPPMLSGNFLAAPELVETFAREVERMTVTAPPAKPKKRAAPKAQPAPTLAPKQSGGTIDTRMERGIRVDTSPASPRPNRPLFADMIAADSNHATVVLLRAGVDLPGGSQSMIGDRVTLPASTAQSLVENGAADFVKETP